MRRRRRIRIAGLALATAAVVTGTASAHVPKTVAIRHQMHGCHTWSFANGPWKATLKVRVDRDTVLSFVNNDVMPHRLVETVGPKANIFTPNMNHIGARAMVIFTKPGVYRFRTKPGEDYPGMAMHTIGEDNVLRLVVTVT